MRMIWPIVAVAAASLGGLAYIWLSNALFESSIKGQRQILSAAQQRVGSPPNALPELMRTYAIRAGGRENGPTMIHARQSAELVVDPAGLPLTIEADQWTGTIVPGLVWRASGTMNRLPVTIVDSYIDGAGALEARVLGAVAASAGSGAAYDKGELMRYLS
ncbi:MAG TPA: DUF6544 family protein, partial [Devosia sp.]|nr:DUF6544 family protein [Devosia sp.]